MRERYKEGSDSCLRSSGCEWSAGRERQEGSLLQDRRPSRKKSCSPTSGLACGRDAHYMPQQSPARLTGVGFPLHGIVAEIEEYVKNASSVSGAMRVGFAGFSLVPEFGRSGSWFPTVRKPPFDFAQDKLQVGHPHLWWRLKFLSKHSPSTAACHDTGRLT